MAKYNPYIAGETQVDLILVMGGDGTILKAVNRMTAVKAKFFGINMGHRGFLSEITPDQIGKTLGRVFAGDYTVDKRMTLDITVKRDKKTVAHFHALNEVAITQSTLSRLISLRAKVNQRKLANYRADGLIVATPTGSTAYSLSAGGPIMHPAMRAFIITPICANSFTQKPIIIPHEKTIEIEVNSDFEFMNATVDGQQSFALKHKDIVHVKQGDFVDFIRLPSESYFITLRQKLGWGD
jgi:NAD+ kinase